MENEFFKWANLISNVFVAVGTISVAILAAFPKRKKYYEISLQKHENGFFGISIRNNTKTDLTLEFENLKIIFLFADDKEVHVASLLSISKKKKMIKKKMILYSGQEVKTSQCDVYINFYDFFCSKNITKNKKIKNIQLSIIDKLKNIGLHEHLKGENVKLIKKEYKRYSKQK